MARVRDTKVRAQRIELAYFKDRHWLRSMRVWLGGLAFLVAAAWIGRYVLARNPTPASPGPVSAAHHMLADRCETCHTERSPEDTKWLGVSNDACQHCHKVPDHQPSDKAIPHQASDGAIPHQKSDGAIRCQMCHVEHRGAPTLADVATAQCTECHRNLAKRATPTMVDPRAFRITAFDASAGDTAHPEFAVWIGGPGAKTRIPLGGVVPLSDASQQIKFNHKLHLSMKPGPHRDRKRYTKLQCGYCHQAPLAAQGRFGKERLHRHVTQPAQFAPAEEPSYFAPIRYQAHCAACHPHSFDDRIDPAPHDTPYVVRRFLEGAYARHARENPAVFKGTPRPRQIACGADATSAPSPEAWAAEQVKRSEEMLYRCPCEPGQKCLRCVECHTVRDQDGPEGPEIVPPAIRTRWLPQSRFDHGMHRELTCTQCHAGVETSTVSSDVLLPGIATCRRCHDNAAASNRCAECHTYHGAMKPNELNGRRTIEEITGSSGGGGT